MKILFDGAIFSMQRFGGISRYYTALFEHLPEEVSASLLLTQGKYSEGSYLPPRLTTFRVPSVPTIKLLRPASRWIDQKMTNRVDRSISVDITHWTYYVGLHRRPVKRLKDRLQVVTVYDMIHENFPETDPKNKETKWKRNAVSEADLLICISDTTLNDLKKWYPECASRAISIPLGNPIEGVTPSALPPALRSKPYVLFVGKRGGYKNFGVVAKAWKHLRSTYPELQLVLVGNAMSREEATDWDLCNCESDLHRMGHVDDSLLAALYKNAVAFVFSSRYEGFGLPAVEAMSCGALLIASPGGALKEVVGNGGVFFDPDDSEHLSDLLCQAVEGFPHLVEVRNAGLERAAKFCWKSTAEKTYAAYKSLLT